MVMRYLLLLNVSALIIHVNTFFTQQIEASNYLVNVCNLCIHIYYLIDTILASHVS